ncbi:DUF2497 domain-containing protein [Rhizobium sp. FY34]|uniref:PopZ family protein n=1 Tax=Rhizobium sp. FY34 TaxID=2562309 RepID=UPI0010C04ACF|nr:DUF2497 domain-containing protein [Rhizobium sp. FY34]
MAQPNVAREPSMEEILASIRRIIESNDPITEGQAAQRPPETAFDDAEDEFDISDEMDPPFLSQVPANDPGLPVADVTDQVHLRGSMEPLMDRKMAQAAAPSSMSVEPQDKTLSLADVAARVRAAAGRVPEPLQARSMPPQTTPVPQPQNMAGALPSVTRFEPVRVEPARMEPARMEASRVETSRVETAPMVAAPFEPVMSELRPAVMQRAEPAAQTSAFPSTMPMSPHLRQDVAPAAEAPARAPASSLPAKIEEAALLLSHEAGEQVARSFKELVDVFNGMERQSVEDMARDMLQPMLREWLDDNLPTLVERLVREEIERVARGPRR